jgi:hypothetical protein
MKQVILSMVAIILGFLIVVFSAWSVGRGQLVGKAGAVSEEELNKAKTASVAAAPKAVKIQTSESDYYLPYPGILPDHPLYIFKAVRDQIRLWLTWNAKDNAKLRLMLADKRIGAAEVLAIGGKQKLADDVALRAEQYLKTVVEKSGSLDDKFKEEVGKAVRKHGEVLVNMKEKANMEVEGVFKTAVEMNQLLLKDVAKWEKDKQPVESKIDQEVKDATLNESATP